MPITRREIIDAVVTMLQNMTTDYYHRTIYAQDTYFDPFQLPPEKLPRFAVVPDPAEGVVDNAGTGIDFTFRVGLYGYCYQIPSQSVNLKDSAEAVIEAVLDALTDNVLVFAAACYSVINVGPIINDVFDDEGNLAYISIPLIFSYYRKS